jgi:hypothetical protein
MQSWRESLETFVEAATPKYKGQPFHISSVFVQFMESEDEMYQALTTGFQFMLIDLTKLVNGLHRVH